MAKMKAPQGCSSATIEGHAYTVDKSGLITVAQENHVATLHRHGFTDYHENEADIEEKIDSSSDKDWLVEFIEERGGEADADMSLKKLRRLAKESLGD